MKMEPKHRERERFVSITNLMHNSFILQQYICYIIVIDMFRAV